MEKIFFVKNGELDEVNTALLRGGVVKEISTVAGNISAYGNYNEKCFVGNVFAYVVVEFKDNNRKE